MEKTSTQAEEAAKETIDQYAKAEGWPRGHASMVKMMLGLIPSPPPKNEPRKRS